MIGNKSSELSQLSKEKLILLRPKFQFQKQLGNFYGDGIRQSWVLPKSSLGCNFKI